MQQSVLSILGKFLCAFDGYSVRYLPSRKKEGDDLFEDIFSGPEIDYMNFHRDMYCAMEKFRSEMHVENPITVKNSTVFHKHTVKRH